MSLTRLTAPIVVAAGLLGLAAPALADSIDGHWCTDAGMRLSIAGPSITTPGGVRMQGDYGRHDFAYTAPASDPGGGGRVTMRLQGEHLMRVDGPGLEPMWRRCGPPTS
ncbi:hypothetical protein AAFN86_09955 [Roseomonas sp. CAU 1739]|uniref:hypothetical protein n=1 Tax=Roseomonas sp. CAU 1739 TaxID=3140364 RepID=UPI00325AC2BD